MPRLYDVTKGQLAVPRALHALVTQSPVRYVRRVLEVGGEVASAVVRDRLTPLRSRIIEVAPGAVVPGKNAIALYVHWSPSGRISNMVHRQMSAWRDCGFDVVFVSNAAPPRSDWTKASEHTVLRIRRSNVGRDFGAWRDSAVLALERFGKPSELLLANDSVLGPLRPLTPLVASWRSGGDGLFGMTESLGGGLHLQSYALLARGAAIKSMLTHLSGLRDSRSKWLTVQRGEIGLTQRMLREGHRCAALFGFSALCALADGNIGEALPLPHRFVPRSLHKLPLNPTHHLWRELIERMGFPYLKTELVRRNPGKIQGVEHWADLVPTDQIGLMKEHLGIMTECEITSDASCI